MTTTTSTTRVASSSTRNRTIKDSNGDNINEHLHNHIHLTNCIHLKNHMHKQSPILTDRVLMRDLIVLQRSRSLRDPSTSPPPWISPSSMVDLLSKKGDYVERSHRFSDSSPKVTLSDERLSLVNDLSCESGRKVKREESSRKSYRLDQSMNSKDRVKKSSVKTLSDQLNEVVCESDDLVSSNLRSQVSNGCNVAHQSGIRGSKRRKFRGTRRIRGKNESSIAPNSLEICLKEQNMNKACGIPLNWSRIHDRGRTFFDKAGRSLSCGKSDSRGNKDESNSEILFPSDVSSSLIHSEAEAFPLLVETGENEDWEHDYSGELGFFADDLLKNQDSDLKKRLGIARHKSFTQKYEPKTFRDLVGQSLVVQALSNAVSRSRLGVLYVFYGPNGTGKSSCARIFAKALNCESIDQFKPCGICNSCVGKSLNIKEVSSVAKFDMMELQETRDHHKVLIFDDCETLSSDCWNLLSKLVNRAPRGVILIVVCSRLEVLPHMIISRCQKFFFPKLKDGDIVKSLRLIASKEEIEISKDALKLIASRSDGSLRDAVMTLEQLSLLGQRISVPLVQELVGLVSDEKLVDLLDLALSADTVNTVKSLRTIMETSVEPLALMSQLATVITDILAGSYDFGKDHRKMKFFRRQPLSKEDMEKLRQALKTLSEAEKQLRVSNEKSTWLTAALLQLAPDQNYLLSHSSMETSLNVSSDAAGRSLGLDRRKDRRRDRKTRPAVEEIWLEVIEKLRVNGLRELLYKEGRIVSLSLGSAPTVHLMFSSELTKSMAEKFCSHIMQAFESVLESPVTIEIRCETRRDSRNRQHYPSAKDDNFQSSLTAIDDFKSGRSEIVDVSEACGQQWRPQEQEQQLSALALARRKQLEASYGQNQSIVRGKVSLGHVIQQAEENRLQKNRSKRRAVSIGEKLEQENLRLEARSRSLLCWKSSKGKRRKVTRLKMKTRRKRGHSLLKLISCGKCLSRS